MSADPWVNEPIPYFATYDEAVRHDVFLLTEPTVEAAGGFDEVRRDPNHPLHNVYDDLDALQRNIEEIVRRAHSALDEEHYIVDAHQGVRLTGAGFDIVGGQVNSVLHTKPVLHYSDDPAFIRDHPDELGPLLSEIDPVPYEHTKAQALRSAILDELAPDIADAGGFPGVARDPNHRRHNSPEGLARVRQQYDQIIERIEPWLTLQDFRESDVYGWVLSHHATDGGLKKAIEQVQDEFRDQAVRENLVDTMDWLVAHRYSELSADKDQSHEDSRNSNISGTGLPDQSADSTSDELVNDVVDRLITGGSWAWAAQQGVEVSNGIGTHTAAEEPKSAAAQAISDVQEVRRHLKELRLGMRPDEYVQVLAGSAANGTSLRQAARDELTRRDSLAEEQQGIEKRLRDEQEQRAARSRQRSSSTTELSR